MFLLKICSQKNDLNTVKIVFCDVIRCAIWVFNFTLLKSSFKIYYVPNEQSIYKMSPSFNELSPIINIRSNFHCWKTKQNINILWWLLCAFFFFFRILNYLTKVFKLLVLFFKKWKNLLRKCADAYPNAEISHHTICKIAVSYRAICKIATSYRAICKIANFYRAICKIAVFYRATCKMAVFYCAICKIVVSYGVIYKTAVSYRAICNIAT